MTAIESISSERTAELRLAFDQSFADPIQEVSRDTVDFILLSLGGDAHAIRMADLAGVLADVKITPCPSPLADLRGIAGLRGTLTPVYDLGALIGYPMSSGRWLMLAKGGVVLALAFDTFDGHFRVESAAIAAHQGTSAARHVHEIVRHADSAWPIIDIPSVVAAIKARAAAVSSQKEH